MKLIKQADMMLVKRIKIFEFLKYSIRIFIIYIVLNVLFAFVLCLIDSFCSKTIDDEIVYAIPFALVISIPMASLNMLFVMFLYLTHINKKVFTERKSAIVECLLFIAIYAAVDCIIDYIPENVKYDYETIDGVTANVYSLNCFFTVEAKSCYTILIMTIIYIVSSIVNKRFLMIDN